MVTPSLVRMTGLLAPHAEGFRAGLISQGYGPHSIEQHLRVMAQLSRWLEAQDVTTAELTSARVGEFVADRRRAGYARYVSERGVAPLLDYLRKLEVVPARTIADSPVEEMLSAYRSYLVRERGVAKSTVRTYEWVARLFLAERSTSGGLDLDDLSAAEVTDFALRECSRHCVGSAKVVITGLRSLLRFLHVDGRTEHQLASAVPAVAGWRGSALPSALDPSRVPRLLASCDRRTKTGRRDYAILMLLSRLGLRAREVAALMLEDIDWHTGEIVIRGKGGFYEKLPLPADVGEAIAAYVRRGRPRVDCRAVFLRVVAPQGPMTAPAVVLVVNRVCRRAGLQEVSSHRLPHTVATEMLRAGARLEEIGQVLRHRSLTTTANYAKVDRNALRAIAQPWPGGAA